ncbi:MAG: hypothetical protein LUG93_14885 [Lachnospiraceae bacterium]|nr:hypothetical protein [Lachnospiraceae bacterium]
MDRDKLRKGIYAIAGIYLLYTAWQLFGGMDGAENTMLMTVFAILFAIMGAALVMWSAWSMYKEHSQGSASESDRGEENSVKMDSVSEEHMPEGNVPKDNMPGDEIPTDRVPEDEGR